MSEALWVEGSIALAEDNHTARNLPSWLEVSYPQSVCQLLKSLAYAAGARSSGREPCSS